MYTVQDKSKLLSNGLEKSDAQDQIPYCPYTHIKCVRYNPLKQRGVCQNHANSNAKSERCIALPYFISDGWHVAVLKGGRLHV